MECLIGIKGKDFTVIACDTMASRSVVAMKKDHDKTLKLSDKILMGVVGESGDTTQFSEYIAKNIQLYRMRNGYELSPHAAASFTRKNLADCLRSSPQYVNMLIGGYSKEQGPKLYFLDYLASMVEVPFAAHGYGSFFILSILDRYYKPDMTLPQIQELLQRCVDEIHKRFIGNLFSFNIRVVNEEGVKELTPLRPTQVAA